MPALFSICAVVLLCLAPPALAEEDLAELPIVTVWDVILDFLTSKSVAKSMPSVSFITEFERAIGENIRYLLLGVESQTFLFFSAFLSGRSPL